MPDATDALISSILDKDGETLVQQMTDIVYDSGGAVIDRASAEQLLRGCVVILQEWLAGESTDVRRSYLETALPEVARSGQSPWVAVLRDGLPCWGLLIGLVTGRAETAQRPAVAHRLALIQGEWWADVWKAMSPVYRERGEL